MNTKLTPPRAEKRPHPITTHGHTRIDNYYWLREKENPEVFAVLEAENAYRDQLMAHTEPLQKTLYDEMVGRIKETDESVPLKDGEYYYYTRTEEGKQYKIYCRKYGSLDGEEQILLDLNAINDANDYDYLSLGLFDVSLDHAILAYGLDTTGTELYTVRFLDLRTGEHLPDVLEDVSYYGEWAKGEYYFYATDDAARRTDKIHLHRLGYTQTADKLVYHEPDNIFSAFLGLTRDEEYIFIGSYSSETYEMSYIPAATPSVSPTLIHPREKGLRYSVSHRKGQFYIVTNADDAVDSKLMVAPVESCGRENWVELVPHRENVRLYDVTMFDDYMVRHEREDGLTGVVITQFSTNETHTIQFEEPIYTVHIDENAEFDTDLIRINYTSLVTPRTIYDYDMRGRTLDLKKRTPVLGYNAELYTTERIFGTAADGTQIPMSLVYRKGALDERPADVHLYGYGSYGVTIDPSFSSSRVSLLDRGIVYVVAHVRGSQMMGRTWYENGKYLYKRNTFTDFVDCAKHLIAAGYTTPEKMTTEGRSAGGLLMGAVLNVAPELFAGAVCGVPFVDVVTTMLDDSIPLTTGEWEEWGNPQDPTYYDYMLSYSPYDNIKPKAYPKLLVTAGLNDPRVQYWEPAKWVQKLRDIKTDTHPVLLKMYMGAGHFSSSGRYDYLKDTAMEVAFLLDLHGKNG